MKITEVSKSQIMKPYDFQLSFSVHKVATLLLATELFAYSGKRTFSLGRAVYKNLLKFAREYEDIRKCRHELNSKIIRGGFPY